MSRSYKRKVFEIVHVEEVKKVNVVKNIAKDMQFSAKVHEIVDPKKSAEQAISHDKEALIEKKTMAEEQYSEKKTVDELHNGESAVSPVEKLKHWKIRQNEKKKNN